MKKELEAKAAGLQFIPASKLQEKVKGGASDEDQEEEEKDEEDSDEDEDESNMFRGVAYRKKEEELVYTGKLSVYILGVISIQLGIENLKHSQRHKVAMIFFFIPNCLDFLLHFKNEKG